MRKTFYAFALIIILGFPQLLMAVDCSTPYSESKHLALKAKIFLKERELERMPEGYPERKQLESRLQVLRSWDKLAEEAREACGAK